MDDIRSGCVVPDNIIRKTVEYMRATSGIFASETVRRIELFPLLCDILGVNILTIQNDDKTTADGTAKSGTKAEDMSFSCLFEEDENEIRDGGSTHRRKLACQQFVPGPRKRYILTIPI